jgi:hypothetical protein
MAAPSTIEVITDATEYCRYESDRKVITAEITITGTAPFTNEPIRVQLIKDKLDRDIAVYDETIIVSNSASPYTFAVSIDLCSLLDTDRIPMVRRGFYFLKVDSVNNPAATAESPSVEVRLISTEKFISDYLFGLKLSSTELKQVKNQPVAITGVTITELSKTHPVGFADLNFSISVQGLNTLRALSWNGGPATTITAPGKYILKGGSSGPITVTPDYVEIRVGAISSLPSVPVVESFIVEEQRIENSTLKSYIDKAISFVENELISCHLEPTVVITDPDPTRYIFTSSSGGVVSIPVNKDYDLISTALTYFSPKKGSWISVRFPYMSILRVNLLYGVIASVRVIDIDPSWIQPSMAGGLIQLIPFNQDVAFSYVGLIWNSSLYGPAELPNFWRYSIVSGLRSCPPELIDLVCKKAAIDILTVLGAALRPGIGSTSLSRDGVSQSVSYVNTQKYGNFTGAIQSYQDYLKDNIPKLRAKYRGAQLVVV